MNDTVSVAVLGIAAFSTFVPSLADAVADHSQYVHIGQAYASAFTLIVGFMLNAIPMALIVIGMNLLAFYHASTRGRIENK